MGYLILFGPLDCLGKKIYGNILDWKSRRLPRMIHSILANVVDEMVDRFFFYNSCIALMKSHKTKAEPFDNCNAPIARASTMP